MKDPIVGPDSRLDFLIYPHALWRLLSGFVQLSGLVEFAILGKATGRKSFWLIGSFRIWVVWSPRLIMAFVHERRSFVLKAIPIRRVTPNRHQYDRVIPAYAKVHPLLKAGSLTSAHVKV
jgi:hypothetical protein